MGDTGELYMATEVDGASVKILIKDSGPGIPHEIQEAIFAPFFTTKDENKGTGLGLSMSRSIIEKFGGQLRLVTSNSQGSEFEIQLPKARKE